ncbi:hypothetical protein BC567DRAFT_228498 [Phyllosticta citribraziliensis]
MMRRLGQLQTTDCSKRNWKQSTPPFYKGSKLLPARSFLMFWWTPDKKSPRIVWQTLLLRCLAQASIRRRLRQRNHGAS